MTDHNSVSTDIEGHRSRIRGRLLAEEAIDLVGLARIPLLEDPIAKQRFDDIIKVEYSAPPVVDAKVAPMTDAEVDNFEMQWLPDPGMPAGRIRTLPVEDLAKIADMLPFLVQLARYLDSDRIKAERASNS